MKKNNGEVERRVDMALMAHRVEEIHTAIYNKDDGVYIRLKEGERRLTANEGEITKIKTIWTTVTVIATVVFNWFTRR